MMPWSRLMWVATLLVGCAMGKAQAFEARSFEDKDGKPWPYRLLKPKDYDAGKRYPMVLFLHGAGESGSDNGLQLKHVVQAFAHPSNMERFPCFVIAPQNPATMKWADVSWGAPAHKQAAEPTPSLAAALELCDAIIKEFSIDRGRIYVVGLSMGGYGTWDALMRQPAFFAAAVPICGGADDEKAALIKDIPVWVFHGAVDPTVPVIRSRNIVAALKAAGGDPKYTEFPNVNHKSWGPAISTPELLPWLFEQKRIVKKPPSDVPQALDRELRTWDLAARVEAGDPAGEDRGGGCHGDSGGRRWADDAYPVPRSQRGGQRLS